MHAKTLVREFQSSRSLKVFILNDVSVTLIDKTDPKDPTKREDFWIQTLKTKAAPGLNVEDGI